MQQNGKPLHFIERKRIAYTRVTTQRFDGVGDNWRALAVAILRAPGPTISGVGRR